METEQEFKKHFYGSANFLGLKSNKLYDQLGKYDDIDEDEYRSYVWFKNHKTLFYIDKNEIIGDVSAPLADAFGHKYLDEPDYFTIDGVRQGMTKENVVNIWGQPDWKAERVWGYSSKGGSSYTNKNYELCVSFGELDGALKVTHFEARVIGPDDHENQPNLNKSMYDMRFEEIYARAADLLGYTESELKSTIGQPDKEFPSENGTDKYCIYTQLEIGLALNSSGIVYGMVCPYNASEQKIHQGYYDVLGLKIGDNVDRIYQMWGTPSEVRQDAFIYSTKLGKTSRGFQYYVELTIEDGLLKWFNCMLLPSNSQKSKGSCFIATVCYGDYDSPEVLILRQYRDNILLSTRLGKALVQLYYFLSPEIAKIIMNSDVLKKIIRNRILAPIVFRIMERDKK